MNRITLFQFFMVFSYVATRTFFSITKNEPYHFISVLYGIFLCCYKEASALIFFSITKMDNLNIDQNT